MAGTYQHYLQRMLQSGFKCPSSGKRYPSVWVYSKTEEPIRRRTEKLGGEDEFYSPTSDGSTITLDDRISSWEARRQADVRAWRQLPDNTAVDARKAAELAGLTGVRTRALRQSFKTMFEEIIPRFAEILQNPDVLMSHIDDRPEIESVLELSIATELGYSIENLAQARKSVDFQAAMRMVKYTMSEVMGHRLALALRELDQIFSDALNSDAFDVSRLHSEAIGKLLDVGGARDDLLSLSWSIRERTSGPEWVLPDCAVLTINNAGDYSPFLFGNGKERSAVILPLTPDRMLIGLEKEQPKLDLAEFTVNAIKCSQQFFIASNLNPELTELHPEIGKTEWGEISSGLEQALTGIDPLRTFRDTTPIPPLSDLSASAYGLEINETELRAIVEPFCQLIFSSTKNFDLSRLKNVVVCGHVASAIGARIGNPDFRYDDGDSRALMNWVECGNGDLAYEFFIHIDAINILQDTDSEHFDFVFSIFLQSLAHMHGRAVLASAATDVDELLEALTLEPVGTYARDAAMNAAITFMDNVYGSRIENPGFEFVKTTAEKLETALVAFFTAPVPRNGTIDERNLAAEALSIAAQELLVCASRYLGICQALGLNPLDGSVVSTSLPDVFEEADLSEWLARLDFDLQRLRVNFAAPLDPERVIALQRHLERLFWSRNTILVASKEGGYILPFANDELTYVMLRNHLKAGIEETLPDNLTEELKEIFK